MDMMDRLVQMVHRNSGIILVQIFPQNIHFRGRFLKCWILRKNSDFDKEKVLKTIGFQDSVVEISGIEPLTS